MTRSNVRGRKHGRNRSICRKLVPVAGAMEPRSDAAWRQAVRIPADAAGAVVETRDYYVSEGVVDVGLRLMCDSVSSGPPVLRLQAVDYVTNQIVGRATVAVDAQATGWQQLPVKIDVRGTNGHSVRLRLLSPGAVALSLASIDIAVDYGFMVVDLTEPLNTFNTHASMFDAHPNERAHAVIAQEVAAALERLR